jgi:hypothetical protein
MQGEITGTILGVDTLVIVVGTHTQVRRVMQLKIESEDIDWAQTPNDNPMLACVPFEEVFYQEVDIGSEVTVSGPVQVRHAVPESQQAAFQAQLDRLNTRLIGTIRNWVKRYGYTDHRAALESAMKAYLNDRIPLPTLFDQIQQIVFGEVTKPPLKLTKLKTEINALLAKRWAVAKQSLLVLWFDGIELFTSESTATEQQSGPLTVIHLENGGIEEFWEKWLAKTKAAQAQ